MKLALAGDTMLGRGVADVLARDGPEVLFAAEVVAAFGEADLAIINLECCVSAGGSPWPDPAKPFFFRAPPVATEALRLLGVDCVTLANNHALDFGTDALLETFEHLRTAGLAWVGAGTNVDGARQPAVLEAAGVRLAVLSVTDHPAGFAASRVSPGVAYMDPRHGVPDWLLESVSHAASVADAVLVTPHWGPNMKPAPLPRIRAAARDLRAAGATIVAGHSAHVFHGVEDKVLYDLGDFLDDYAVDPALRNDLGLLFIVTLDPLPRRVEAIPLFLGYCHTRLASGDEATWIRRRYRAACCDFGTEVSEAGGRLIIDWSETA